MERPPHRIERCHQVDDDDVLLWRVCGARTTIRVSHEQRPLSINHYKTLSMALRVLGRHAVRVAAAAASRSQTCVLVSCCSRLGAVDIAGPCQTRSFAKVKKSKGTGASIVTGDSAEDAGDDAEDGGAARALEKAKQNMHGAVVSFTRALSRMRPGRADAGIFDELHVQAYGQHVPLAQVAQVAVVSAHALSVSVYDPSVRAEEGRLLRVLTGQRCDRSFMYYSSACAGCEASY